MITDSIAAQSATIESTLVFCLDFEGCTDTASARTKLIENIVTIAMINQQYRKLLICIGSTSQFVYFDAYTSHSYYEMNDGQYISCAILGRAFMIELLRALSSAFDAGEAPDLAFYRQLTSDVYNKIPTGSTFSLMNGLTYQDGFNLGKSIELLTTDELGRPVTLCGWNNNRLIKNKGGAYFGNSKKLDILYMFMQGIALELGEKDLFKLVFVDNDIQILSDSHYFYSINSDLIPLSCRFQVMEFNSIDQRYSVVPGSINSIQGSGKINKAYKETMYDSYKQITIGLNKCTLETVLPHCHKIQMCAIDTGNQEPFNFYFLNSKPGKENQLIALSASDLKYLFCPIKPPPVVECHESFYKFFRPEAIKTALNQDDTNAVNIQKR